MIFYGPSRVSTLKERQSELNLYQSVTVSQVFRANLAGVSCYLESSQTNKGGEMKNLRLNGLSLYLHCGACGQGFEQKLESLKQDVQGRCPACNAVKTINSDAKRKVIHLYNDLQKALDTGVH